MLLTIEQWMSTLQGVWCIDVCMGKDQLFSMVVRQPLERALYYVTLSRSIFLGLFLTLLLAVNEASRLWHLQDMDCKVPEKSAN